MSGGLKLARHCSELANSHEGTINVDVGSPIDFLKIDFRTPAMGDLPEVEFVQVRFEFPIGNILDEKHGFTSLTDFIGAY
jgi:hypothetical protein